ncbi:DUF7269 family protein [Natronomonas marina]|jgi:hypothetical protein|uniref:DUF7269 family protein n=1 Tax=Natronomonas marina TaxID=2961939 RepID=UPI0020C96FAE|nr:hypothetical protein [Natronomonas marina]
MTDRLLRVAVAAVGVAAVTGSAALFFEPGAAGAVLPVAAIAETTTLSAAGARALAFGAVGAGCLLWVASASRRTGDDAPSEPAFPPLAAEDAGTTAVAVGDGFDRNVGETLAAVAEGDDRDAVRSDLRSLAVAVVAHVEGCSRRTARQRVTDGEWTDDPVAAAYLARDPGLPLRRRLLARLRPRASKRRRIERTVAAVESLLDGEGRSG